MRHVRSLVISDLAKTVTEILQNQVFQSWGAELNESSKGRTYGIFKETIELEPYLTKLPPRLYTPLAKLRTANHRFPCEVLRWHRPKIELCDRLCHLCDQQDVGDEIHYLFICPVFAEERRKHIKRYYFTRPNIVKFKELLNTSNMSEMRNLCLFLEILLKKRCSP